MVLAEKSRKQKYTATLLPIRTVGVQVDYLLLYLMFYLFVSPVYSTFYAQGDQRTYSYAVGISSVSYGKRI